MSENPILMTQAQYARHRNKSPQCVGKLVKAGVLVMRGRMVDAVASDAVLNDKPVERTAPDGQPPSNYAQAKLADMVFRAKLRRIALPVAACCIDSGYESQAVYDFCRTRYHRRVFAVKGQGRAASGVAEEADGEEHSRRASVDGGRRFGQGHHHGTVADGVELLRRVPPKHLYLDAGLGRWRPSSAAFEDDEDGDPMSVYGMSSKQREVTSAGSWSGTRATLLPSSPSGKYGPGAKPFTPTHCSRSPHINPFEMIFSADA